MLNTKLILIEGLPGAGKSTTTRRLGTALRQRGLACQWYLEEAEPHPIACLDFPLKELDQKLPRLWRAFAEQALQTSGVTIIESRLWQNTALFMYMSRFPVTEIRQLQQRVWQAFAPLSPALVYLYQDNVETALRRLSTLRDETSLNADFRLLGEYPWFQSRGLSGAAGWAQFFGEWQGVAAQLYDDWPSPKLRVVNAQDDWESAYRQMGQFLRLAPNS